MTNQLIQYIRNNRNVPVGVVIATRVSDSSALIGWSKLHVSAGDVWDRKRGIEIAMNRAFSGTGPEVTVPHCIAPVIAKMGERAKAYFKGVTTIV